MRRVELHPEAVRELETSERWYSARSPRAGISFVEAVASRLDEIVHDPERFAKVDERHRACGVSGFPFQILFRTTAEEITVIAVAHSKRAQAIGGNETDACIDWAKPSP